MIARMIIGLPGSGKNYYVKQYHSDVVHISRDDIRSMFQVKFSEEIEQVVVESARCMYAIAAAKRIDIIVNETFTKTISRIHMIERLKMLGYEVNGVFLNTPVELCMERRMRDNRGCINWCDIICSMNSYFVHPTMDEGYDDLLIHHEGV